MTEETKRKISKSKMGHLVSEETRKKISEAKKGQISWNRGLKFTDKAKLSMSLAHLGVKLSEEHRTKIGEGHRGLKMDATIRKKISEANKGKTLSKKTRKKLSEAHKGKRRPQTIETRKLLSIQRMGINAPGYIDGKGYERDSKRKMEMDGFKYKIWREQIFKRDDFTCQICKVKGGQLQADHIKPWATYPELRYELDNGRTLCVSCHRKTPTWGRITHGCR